MVDGTRDELIIVGLSFDISWTIGLLFLCDSRPKFQYEAVDGWIYCLSLREIIFYYKYTLTCDVTLIHTVLFDSRISPPFSSVSKKTSFYSSRRINKILLIQTVVPRYYSQHGRTPVCPSTTRLQERLHINIRSNTKNV